MKPMYDNPSGGRVYNSQDGRMFGAIRPFDGESATVGNGVMIGFAYNTRSQVDTFHARALALGGSCEGFPGVRGGDAKNAYLAHVRDLDGNKLCAYKLDPE